VFLFHLKEATAFIPKCSAKVKVKLSLKEAVEAYRVVRCQGSHTFYTIHPQMEVTSVLSAGRVSLPRKIPGTISVRG
jgi:hypothetical protein